MSTPANTAVADKLITADDLLQHPEWGRCELIEGKVVFMSPAGAEHGGIAGNIYGEMYIHVRQRNLGRVFAAETGFILSKNPDTVRAPDVMFVSASRIPPAGLPKGFLQIPPDLAVEVVSPGDAFSDVTQKAESYTQAGVKLVWVVDPQTQRAYVFRPGKPVANFDIGGALSGDDVLPGFLLSLKDVFR